MRKVILPIVIVLLTLQICSFAVPPYYGNEIPIISSTKQFSFGFTFLSYKKYTIQSEEEYFIYELGLFSKYIPNKSVELSFYIPYLLMSNVNDYGILGDIKIFSKFALFSDLFQFIDTIYFNNSLVVNVSLATGEKREDGCRNIGLDKGLYYPISSGYSDLDIGITSGLVFTYFSFFTSVVFISSSSKTEPPLAFNTENDSFKVGFTSEIFLFTSKNISIKPFLELTLIIPVSDKAKFLNSNVVGFGIWAKIVDSFVLKAGYYQNLNKIIDERYVGNIISTSFEYRF